jgi:metallo-beta-lactamase family protein
VTGSSPVLTFAGGAGTVTGSKTILDTARGRILVDCGLFQGRKKLRLQNWTPFPVPPESIDAVVLTHAHLDHCGYLPRLTRLGFTGPVYCTPGTHRLAEIVLPDSGHLQEEEARFANRKGYSKHDPAQPLYTRTDALASLDHFETVPFDRSREVIGGVEVTWHRAGHILGAATVALHLVDDDIVTRFSGDLGTSRHPLLLPPAPIGRADVVVTESTYGDEEHSHADPEEAIAEAVAHVVDREGVLIIPAFAVDRTEVVLWHLDRLISDGRIPDIPVFVDSPMACRSLDVYQSEAHGGSPEFRPELHGADLFPSVRLTQVTSVDDSKSLNSLRGPAVIVSASGMATGGRVIHHLAQRIGNRDNAVMLVGFQAPGTRGDSLRSGAQQLKMFGQYYPVEAKVFSVDLSAHADRTDLINWLGTAAPAPRMIYVNHGEPPASDALVEAIHSRLGVNAVVPRPGERIRLDPIPTSPSGRQARS